MTLDNELANDEELGRLFAKLRSLHDRLLIAECVHSRAWEIAALREECDFVGHAWGDRVTEIGLVRMMREDGMTLGEAFEQALHEGACIEAAAPRPQ
ncbi:MAG: hypothetical protein ACR2HE_10865 [Casimicrobiaceae bacterium]